MLDHPMIVLIWQTSREGSLEVRRPEGDGSWMLMREAMYLGEENFNARKVMSKTLYVSRCSAGYK